MISVFSFGTFGMDSYVVRVEADYAKGLFSFEVVGLPDAAVQESKERVKAAIRNSGFEMPIGHYVVNLSPADVKKAGPMYDLPILMAILADSGQIEFDVKANAFIGELSLDGELRPVRGIVGMLIAARQAVLKTYSSPRATATRAAPLRVSRCTRQKASTKFMRTSKADRRLNPPCF